MHIAILSSSVREKRNSHRVGQYLKNFLNEDGVVSSDLIDLFEYQFPLFEERLRFMKNPSSEIVHFAERIKKAYGVIVVAPEYNGGYPASLKNVIDLLSDEWKGKPTGIVTVSTGPFGGALLLPSLLFSLWKKGVWVINARYHVPKVDTAFDENGLPADIQGSDQRTRIFMDQLFWCMEARRRMDQ